MQLNCRHVVTTLLVTAGLIGACAGNPPASDAGARKECPPGQLLVCRGGTGNSSVDDSKLNENEVCICRSDSGR